MLNFIYFNICIVQMISFVEGGGELKTGFLFRLSSVSSAFEQNNVISPNSWMKTATNILTLQPYLCWGT